MVKRSDWEAVVPGKTGAIVQVLSIHAADAYAKDSVEGSVFLVTKDSVKYWWDDNDTWALENVVVLKGNGFLSNLAGKITHFHSCTFRVLFSW